MFFLVLWMAFVMFICIFSKRKYKETLKKIGNTIWNEFILRDGDDKYEEENKLS